MKLLDIIESSEKDVIVITSNEKKHTILKTMHQAGVIQPVSFMNKQDLFEKVFFKYSIDALYEAARYLKLSLAITQSWLEYLYFIDENTEYTHPRLKQLKTLKKHLLDTGKIQKNIFSDVWLQDKKVIVYTPHYDALLLRAIKKIETIHNDVAYVDSRKEKYGNITFKQYLTLEEEITDVAIQIKHYRQQNYAYDSMSIMNIDESYIPLMKRIFNWFDIPLNLREQTPIIGLSLTKRFLNAFKNSEETSFENALKEALKTIKPLIDSKESAQVYQNIIRVLNPMVRYIKNKNAHFEYIHYTLAHTFIKREAYLNAVNVISDIKGSSDDEIVFLMALKEGNAPKYRLDDDFLSAEEKQVIDYPIASEINHLLKKQYEDALFYTKKVYASFSESSFSESYSLSTFIKECLNTEPIKKGKVDVHQPYSPTFDKVQSKIEKDYYDLYRDERPFYKAFSYKYQETFNTYDNTFDNLSAPTMDQLLKKKPSFSVTQIEDYFACGLTFLLKHFLKITPSDSPFYRHLGTFFHEVLENHITKDTLDESNLKAILASVLKDDMDHYTQKDLFFFEKSFPFILKAHEIIKAQEKSTLYDVTSRELSIQKPYTFKGITLQFKGKIDKVLSLDGSTLLIDYKTGSNTLNLFHAPFGLHSQLIFYALLYQYNYPSDHVDGVYEQTILPSKIKAKKNESYNDLLSQYYQWKGYTLKDESTITNIDPKMEKESEILNDVKFKADGAFTKHSKLYERDDLNALIDHLETLLKTATQSIINGQFPINPKRIDNHDVSCEYCPYEDICFKQEKDYQNHHTPKTISDLFSRIKEGVYHER